MERALATLDPEEVQIKINWLPFELDPNLPEKSVNKIESYNSKFGKDKVAGMIPYMKQVGEGDEIKFSYGGNVGNTFRSHRLVELASETDPSGYLTNKLIDVLFVAYFEQEKDIADNAYLAEAAKEVGLFGTEKEALDFIKSDALVTECRAKQAINKEERISGVPYFKISFSGTPDEQIRFSGGQESQTFLDMFKKWGVSTSATTTRTGAELSKWIESTFLAPTTTTSTTTSTTTTTTT